MTKYILLVLATLAFIAGAPLESRAQDQRATAVVRTKLSKSVSQKALVEKGIDIMHVYPDGRVDLAVTDEQLAWISSKGASVSVLERIDLAAPATLDANLGAYYTHAEMEAGLDSLVAAHPTLARIDTLGTTYLGNYIRAIKISKNVTVDENEPEVFIMGCHHARELMSVEVPMRLAKYLLANYGTDPVVTNIVNTREIWIAPMINIDGHVWVELNHAGSSVNWWRKNRRVNGDGSIGVDLNRNYSYKWGYDNVGSSPTPASDVYRGSGPFSEPETQAVRNFCARHHFTLSISYHSYGDLILYPWGYAALNTMDQDLFSALGDTLRYGNDYLAGNVASGAIYLTNGGSEDWLYGDTQTKNVVYAFTVELNSYEEGGFSPPESLILPTFNNVLGLNLTLLTLADNPSRILGPWAPQMGPVTALNPPAYQISWTGSDPHDPNPAVSYDLTEIKNLTTRTDSVEAGDALWTADGFALSSARASAGSYSWYSGRGDNLHQTLSMVNIYPMGLPTTLTCRLWYDIENGWDYAYLEGSTDDGKTWITLPGNRTTNVNPNGNNRGNGITGSSGLWVSATFDLTNLMVTETGFALLRFDYITDESVNNEGIYIDLVSPVTRADRSSVIASNILNTWYHRWPQELGNFLYCVKAFDAEGQGSARSDLAARQVTDLTSAAPPAPLSSLEQNYPNPFNPSTTLSFTVGAGDAPGGGTAPVSLRLYDVSGRLVAVVREGRLSAGRYSVTWNGLENTGRAVASGIYFARLRVGDRVFVRKIVLAR
ncbi:MAG: M14 family zinc carboxypeptidase [Candidatus Krumholzibacteriaceae bacterium]